MVGEFVLFLFVMPAGVEHPAREYQRAAADMALFLFVMPAGVEHHWSASAFSTRCNLFLFVMPAGVEHRS